jgi:hypothetical protein
MPPPRLRQVPAGDHGWRLVLGSSRVWSAIVACVKSGKVVVRFFTLAYQRMRTAFVRRKVVLRFFFNLSAYMYGLC